MLNDLVYEAEPFGGWTLDGPIGAAAGNVCAQNS
jgi:hypothetical protein